MYDIVAKAILDYGYVYIPYRTAKTNVAKLKANITKTGYDADEVTADPKGYA